MKPDRVTVIVLNWNRCAETVACLASLRAADLQGASILVVDNGSRDDSVAEIRRQFPEVEVLSLSENRGYAGGNNAGIRLALERGAEGVLLLNNDTEVSPDFLPPLAWTFDLFPRAAAVSSAIHRFDRRDVLNVAYQDLRFDHRDVVRMRGVNVFPHQGYSLDHEVDVAIGCSLLLDAGALREVGLFDEAYFAYYEEVDWCIRARRLGYRIVYQPFSRVFHLGSVSTRDLFPPETADLRAPRDTELPTAEPQPWNPVRSYLGARNRIRLLRAHASRDEKSAFLRSNFYELPLEFFAIVMHRQGWMRLGVWGYKSMARYFFVERHGNAYPSGAVGRLVRFLRDLFVDLPAVVIRAHRLGRMAEFYAQLRGLFDGVFDRELPLRRLGLR